MRIFAQRHPSNVANIVLVHGFWSDASGWRKIIPMLQAQGYFVIAVQNSLISLSDDVATTRRMLAELEGPTLLVGHAYGGFVISEAASGASEVVGLVYISAFMLDEGETILSLGNQFSPLEVYRHLLIDERGFAWIDPEAFPRYFADDIDLVEAQVLAVTQRPAAGSILNTRAGTPAWKKLPSWSLFGVHDRMVHPDQHHWMAQRSRATTYEIEASHVPHLSHPDEVAQVILTAAQKAMTGGSS